LDEFVVGVDGSEDSRSALRWAARMATAAHVPLRVFQAWSYPKTSILPGTPAPKPAEEMDAAAVADASSVVKETFGDIPSFVQIESLRGAPAAAILASVRPDSVLCLGSRGLGGFTGMLLGSVSRACIENAVCPVVIARDAGSQQADARPVLVGMDGSEGATLALDWAVTVGGFTGAPVAAVYAWEPTSSETRPRLHRRLHAKAQKAITEWVGNRKAEPIEMEGDPRAALVALAEERQAGMLVVGRRGTSRLRGITTGGVTSYLVTNSPTSICVIPPASPST